MEVVAAEIIKGTEYHDIYYATEAALELCASMFVPIVCEILDNAIPYKRKAKQPALFQEATA